MQYVTQGSDMEAIQAAAPLVGWVYQMQSAAAFVKTLDMTRSLG